MNTAESLYAIQHVRQMRGGSKSHLIRASDNNLYVTKFQNNPQHTRVLVGEYLGTKLGIFLGLPMPEVRILEVSDSLVASTPDLRIQIAGMSIPCASGLQVASRYVAKSPRDRVFDHLPETLLSRIINQQDFRRVLTFDKWTGNTDGRQVAFVKSPNTHFYRAVFIDQGNCFNAGEWTFPDLDLHGVYYQNELYQGVTGWDSFEPTLSRLEKINSSDLWTIASEIPEDWYQYDSEGLSHLIEALQKRQSLVRELITNFRISSRNPFPNWTTT